MNRAAWRFVVAVRWTLAGIGNAFLTRGLPGFGGFFWLLADQTLPACYALHRDGFHL